MKKILNIILFSILGLIISFNLYSIIYIRVLGNDYINLFGYTYFEVKTGSMSPTLNINDIIIVKTNEDYNVKDIVTYKENNVFITHRIIKKDGDKFITMGDSNDKEDDPISKEQIVGSVVKRYEKLGIVTKILQSPTTLILIFAIGMLIIIYSCIDKKEKE